MANDRPTSLSMRFGREQHLKSGMGGMRAARSPAQFNKITRQSKAEREATASLREISQDKDWILYIKHRAGEGCSAVVIDEEVSWMKRYSRMRRRFSTTFCLKYHWYA